MSGKKVCLALFLLLGVLLGGCAFGVSDASEPARLFAEANRFYADGNYKAAGEGLLRLSKKFSRNPRVFNNLGNVYLKEGDPDAAQSAYEKALELNPGYVIARVNLAVLLLRSRKTKEAYAEFLEILKAYRDDADIRNGLGVCELRQGRIKEGVNHFRKAIDIQGDFPLFYNNLAFAYAESNEYLNESLKMAKEALKAEPGNPVFLDTLGWIYFKRGVFDRSIQLLQNALGRAPAQEEIRSHLVSVYRWLGREKEAVALIREGGRERAMQTH
ncbi:MAG: tetratricopeptide repeat protein [Deltaproteobacteria bacterium]|nr:tetratricopeptide repeat protein [Deltaproteobacteria bacterium]